MNLSWSNRVIKYVLFVFNLLFVISGIIMIAVGVSVKSYYTEYDIFLNDSYFSLPNLLIAIGSLIFFISFFGCCGAVRESWFMIFIFSILLSVIFIMEFSAGIAGYVLRDKTTSFLTEELSKSMDKYQFNAKPNPTTVMWDTIQYEFECCGATKPDDWAKYVPTSSTTKMVPTTVPSSSETTPSTNSSSSETPPTSSTSSTNESTLPTNTSAPITVNARRKRQAVAETGTESGDLPASCCKSNNGATGTIKCNLNDNSSATYYSRGCVEGFGDYLKDHAVTLGGVGIAIAFIQLFGVVLACHLTKQLKHGFYST